MRGFGIPTADMNMGEVGRAVKGIPSGVYFGFAMLRSMLYATVVAVGWNPRGELEQTVVSLLFSCWMRDVAGLSNQ